MSPRRALWSDPIILSGAAVLSAIALCYLLPGIAPGVRQFVAIYLSNLLPLALTIAALLVGLDRLEPSERTVWRFWAGAFSLWLVQDSLGSLSVYRPSTLSSFLQDALHVGFYLLLVFGLQREPHRGGMPGAPVLLRRLQAAGTALFAFGLLSYLPGIPLLFERPLFATQVPSLILYLILDADLLIRLLDAHRAAARCPRWRAIYAWLVVTAALWIATDAAEAMGYVSLLDLPPAGPADVVWLLPFATFLVAVRIREPVGGQAAPASPREPREATHPAEVLGALWGDALVAYTAAFPLLHFVLHGSGALAAASPPAREALTLVLLTLLAGLALTYQRLLLAENRRLEAERLQAVRLEHRAYHDALTGLPNRYLLLDRLHIALARARRAQTRIALFFLDLDRFKVINDTLGHTAGDAVLQQVGIRLARHVRQGDTLARLGGDEFIVLVEALRRAEDTASIAHKLLEELHAPFTFEGKGLFLTASVGVSLFPDDAEEEAALLQHADLAMYRAKAGGGDGLRLYRSDMNLRSEERLSLESSLRKAVGLGQFALQFQPIVDLAGGGLAGCEALLRWRHPERGLLLPASFIEVAEMTGVISSLGPWLLRAACREARAWQHPARPPLPVAVNVSPRQFQEPGLLSGIRTILEEEGLPAPCLELEISETLAMQNPGRTTEILQALKELGVAVSIDAFGTGYSSLACLKRFPIGTLKIDRSFVSGIDQDPADATIAATVIAMARRLDLRVVAEGVEREEQREWLLREGCDRAQGHLFCPPLWPAQLAARLAEAEGGRPFRAAAREGVVPPKDAPGG